MKAKKIIGGVSAAIAMLTMSTFALAEECAVVADDVKTLALMYGCDGGENKYQYELDEIDPNTGEPKIAKGEWPFQNPIWQWKGTKGDGCKVHLSLVAQLYLPHPEDEPPRNTNKNKPNNGFKEAKGAANALLDNKPADAWYHLQNVIDAVDPNTGSAKINTKFTKRKWWTGANFEPADAEWFAGELSRIAKSLQERIYDPVTQEVICSVP